MKILFVINEVFYSEPLGVMQLSSLLKQAGHETKLSVLKKNTFTKDLAAFQPDVIAYSVMSPEVRIFQEIDEEVKTYSAHTKKKILRVMGGPHPTYFQDILNRLDLDAICIGEGDHALTNIVANFSQGAELDNIPNVLCKDRKHCDKEIIDHLDALPFCDKQLLYDAAPEMQKIGIRSIITSRGCPYNCTYCFNHAYKKMFSGVGTILRRRSVDSVIEEIKYITKNYQPVNIIRFGDDTFVYEVDKWLLAFAERYREEIGIPFYCLMRSNTLTEDVARLLSDAGCISVCMSLESGNEYVRNTILKRNLSDEAIIASFQIARKYQLATFGASMLGIPGTSLEDDLETIQFAKRLKISAPAFWVFKPYPGTELTKDAIEKGLLDPESAIFEMYRSESPLNCYSDRQKRIQLRLAYLGPFYCFLPSGWFPLLTLFAKLKLTGLYSLLNSLFFSYLLSAKIFPNAFPRNPMTILKHIWLSTRYWMNSPKKEADT